MKRKALNNLIEWKNNSLGPLLLTGVRGVGKTFLAFEFASSFFENIVYINLEQNISLYDLFAHASVNKVSEELELYYQTKLNKKSLLIIDEFIFCEHAVRFIEQYAKESLGFRLIAITSFPCRMNLSALKLYPFDFEEYLAASGHEWYGEVIKEHYKSNKKVPEIVHKELLELYQEFLIIGGMPGAINEYMSTNLIFNVPDYHRTMLNNYMSDADTFSKEGEFIKIKNTYQTIEMHLLKSNKKFQYRMIRQGITKKLYLGAIQYLMGSNIVLACRKMDDDAFKLYFADTGMLLSKTNASHVLTADNNEELMRSMLENSVALSLVSGGYKLRYWESCSQAKVDFVIRRSGKWIPIEINTAGSTKSKHISVFKKHYDMSYSIRISEENFGFSSQVKYVPVYAAFCLGAGIDSNHFVM